MWHHHILRALLVRGLTNILVVGGLGVEDHQNHLREVPTCFKRFRFVGLSHRRSPTMKTENI
jgi:hypothetical protein